ncbi:MAG: hypothetical protein WD875_04910 [Pirellulales bacterium]
METSLHRQLKTLYAGNDGQCEVCLDEYRIDVVRRKRLYEIQHGSLSAIRGKVLKLLASHRVVVVKPIVVDKQIVHLDGPDGNAVRRRLSPKHGRLVDLFDELVYFVGAFPHPRLTLEFPLIVVEETRYPGHGRRRRWRENDFVVADQRLTQIGETHRARSAGDLWRMLGGPLPSPFDTAELSRRLDAPRSLAQRIAYCLLHSGAATQVGKRGNARLYEARHGTRPPRQKSA